MFDCLLLMAGDGLRSGLPYNKIKFIVNNKPLYQYSLDIFKSIKECKNIILVVNEKDYEDFKILKDDRIKVVVGGDKRSRSVFLGAKETTSDIIIIHDAARPNINVQDVMQVYDASIASGASALGVPAKDCLKEVNNSIVKKTIDRKTVWQIQTPQAVKRSLLIEGLAKTSDIDYYDDVEVLEKNFDIKTQIVMGHYDNIKVTTKEDLYYIRYLLGDNMKQQYRIGHSSDTHKLVNNRPLILGGITIPYSRGLLGHSDADIVLHALSEAIIGALGLGDLGMMFPDTDKQYKDMNSCYFVNKVYEKMIECGYVINNIDIIIYIEEPYLNKYKHLMAEKIAELLKTNIHNINIKATRKEGLGYIGNLEGLTAEAIALLVLNN